MSDRAGKVGRLYDPPHECRPGWSQDTRGELRQFHGAEGDVWRCTCDRLFLCVPPPVVTRGQQLCVNVWRPLTRRELRQWRKEQAKP